MTALAPVLRGKPSRNAGDKDDTTRHLSGRSVRVLAFGLAFMFSASRMTTRERAAGKWNGILTLDKQLDAWQGAHMNDIRPGSVAKEKEAKSTGIRGMLADIREFAKLTKLHGGLVPMSAVATILGVSRQRVHQLVDEGTFKHWTFYGMKWLSQEEVVSFAKLNRPKGENQYSPSTKQMWKESREMGKEFVQKRSGQGGS